MPAISEIADGFRKSATLLLGVIADAVEAVRLAIIPPIPPPQGIEKMRAVQVSSILVIVLLALWLEEPQSLPTTDHTSLTLVLVTLLLFHAPSWIVR